jgi:FtsP/CotA-like multicopper oxidase with cupredoxin domain
VLQAERGKQLAIGFKNALAEPVSLYWPGVRGAPDFLASKPISPGETRNVSLTPRDAGTFWYRAFAPSQSERGLHGLLVVPDGVMVDREVPLVISARPSDAGGFDVVVNGQKNPDVAVRAGERVRFRILNASRDQLMVLRFGSADATIVALDGQPAEPFLARDGQVPLAPGGRADVIVDMEGKPGTAVPIVVATQAGARDAAQLRNSAEASIRTGKLAPPSALPANTALPSRMDFGRSLRSELSLDRAAMRAPNPGQTAQRPVKLWGPIEPALEWPAPALTAKRGQTVMIALRNDGPHPVAVHIQGHPFRLLDSLDDGWKPYWLDTVVALPQRTTRIALVADTAGKWPIVCQPLMGSGDPFIGWFETT